jgi:hypothetical protein
MSISSESAVEKLSEWKTKSPPLLLSINVGDVFLVSFCEVASVDAVTLHLTLRGGKSKLLLTIHNASFEQSVMPIPVEGKPTDFERLAIKFRRGGSCSLQEMPDLESWPEVILDEP